MYRTLWLAALLASSLPLAPRAQPSAGTALEANTAFEAALAIHDRAALDTLLDPEFSWIFPDGSLYGRLDTLLSIPSPAPGANGAATKIEERQYGRVRAVEVSSGLTYALRIWVFRPEGWRLAHINELVEAPARANTGTPSRPAYRDTVTVPNCSNPCESVPYLPTTQRALDALRSWQQQELGSHTMDMQLWGAYVTDDWIGRRHGGTANPKEQRISLTNRRAESGIERSAQATVLQMRLYDLEDAVLMVSLTQGLRSQPEYRTRIFVHDGERADGGARYKMAESYGQVVSGTPIFERVEN